MSQNAHEKILRSLIREGDPMDQTLHKDLVDNYTILDSSGIRFDDESGKVWAFLRSFYIEFKEVSHIDVAVKFFADKRDTNTSDYIDVLRSIVPVYRSEFQVLVKDTLNTQKTRDFATLLQKSAQILSVGVVIKKDKEEKYYKGYSDAMKHIMENADYFLSAPSGSKNSGDLNDDTEELRANFEHAIAHPGQSWGYASGLEPIDNVCRGLKPGELWIHAGSIGEMKTSFAMNWAYKQAFVYGHNVYYYSLEMPYSQIRLMFAVMHSANPKFVQKGYPLLSYAAIRDGVNPDGSMVSAKDIEYYDFLLKDIDSNKDYGRLHIEVPTEPVTILEMRHKMEVYHQNTPIHMAVIDHLLLVRPQKITSNPYMDLNTVMRGAKMLAMHFNGGERLPLLGLLQINRKGKEEADKNDGIYKTQALADANEAERSADVISYSYLNSDLRNANQVKIGCLKNRENPHFQPFTASVDWGPRYIGHHYDQSGSLPDINALELLGN